MTVTDFFSRYHPLVIFTYFAFMLTFSMITMHPLCIAITLICSVFYVIYLNGTKAFRLIFYSAVPMLLMTAVFNPLFNHRGSTVLCFFPSGNPLTLESVIYGVMAGGVFAAVILWFSCLNRVLTADKLLYLFGRFLPGLSLILSMILRFVPLFSKQISKIIAAQKCLGYNVKSISGILSVISALITWCLEDGLTTASSMRSRGFGSSIRTSYTPYRITQGDIFAIIWQILCAVPVVYALLSGSFSFTYYPSFSWNFSSSAFVYFTAYTALGITPLLINIKEELMWKLTE